MALVVLGRGRDIKRFMRTLVVLVLMVIFLSQKTVTEAIAIIMVHHTVQVVPVDPDLLELVVNTVSFKIISHNVVESHKIRAFIPFIASFCSVMLLFLRHDPKGKTKAVGEVGRGPAPPPFQGKSERSPEFNPGPRFFAICATYLVCKSEI